MLAKLIFLHITVALEAMNLIFTYLLMNLKTVKSWRALSWMKIGFKCSIRSVNHNGHYHHNRLNVE